MSSYTPAHGAGRETIRFRGPTKDVKLDANGESMKPKRWIDRHTGLMVDLLRRSARPPWMPSLSLAFRIFIFLRFTAAMYTAISDCDEVFNFWEPLHYLSHNSGFQTWELSPRYAIRSWAYVSAFLQSAEVVPYLMTLGKRQSFFCVRITFAFLCTFAEARFYRAIVDHVNDRTGRYFLFAMLFSAGMWNASTAFLPSTTAMHTTLLAYSFYLQPTSSDGERSTRRVYLATFFFALGAVFAWPFALLLAVPFVVEELFIGGKDVLSSNADEKMSWRVGRIKRLLGAAAASSLLFIPIGLVDSYAYGKPTLPALNIILYNLFSTTGGSPNLYGTEPPTFYLANLLLNFNILLPLALLSLPILAVTFQIDYRRLGSTQRRPKAGETSPYTLMALRLSGFYIWLGVLSLQPHKEERFMYPAYPLLGLNAAVSLFLLRGLVEKGFEKWKQSSYQASNTKLMGNLTLATILGTIFLSISRIVALQTYYVAPLRTSYFLETSELPSLLRSQGFSPIQHNGTNDWDEWDLSPLKDFNEGRGLRLCYGKDWYRYTSSWLVPEGIEVRWIKSEFDGQMPGKWRPSEATKGGWWRRDGTRWDTEGLNDLNEEDSSQYVEPLSCDYLLDSNYPLRSAPSPSSLEPNYAADEKIWERLHCHRLLDAEHSSTLQRAFWLPGSWWSSKLGWGEFCLLGRRQGREGREDMRDE